MKRTMGILLALALTVTLCACGKKSGGSWQEQYDLGVRYLSEGNYEEAVIAFTAAIEIDPKRPEAYHGLADAHIGAGDLDAARKALEDGLTATDDNGLRELLADLPWKQETAVRTARRELDNGMYDICEYNDADAMFRFTRYTGDGSVYFVHDYLYDNEGTKIAAKITYPDGGWRNFVFDDAGRTIVEVDHWVDGDVERQVFLYDGAVVTISLQMDVPEKEMAVTCSFPYTMEAEDHQVDTYAGVDFHYETGSVGYVTVTERDSRGEQVAVRTFDGSGNPLELQAQ